MTTLALFILSYSLVIAWHHAKRLAHQLTEEGR